MSEVDFVLVFLACKAYDSKRTLLPRQLIVYFLSMFTRNLNERVGVVILF